VYFNVNLKLLTNLIISAFVGVRTALINYRSLITNGLNSVMSGAI